MFNRGESSKQARRGGGAGKEKKWAWKILRQARETDEQESIRFSHRMGREEAKRERGPEGPLPARKVAQGFLSRPSVSLRLGHAL